MIAARCEMLLSPGTLISVSIRGARLTRNSIEPIENFFAELSAAARCSCGRAHQHPISAALVQLSSAARKADCGQNRRPPIVDLTERGKSSLYKDP
jgi:hypothetical protein